MEMNNVKLIFWFGKPVVRNEPINTINAPKMIIFQNQLIFYLSEVPTNLILYAERSNNRSLENSEISKYLTKIHNLLFHLIASKITEIWNVWIKWKSIFILNEIMLERKNSEYLSSFFRVEEHQSIDGFVYSFNIFQISIHLINVNQNTFLL
jgi:hypothetical protein